MPFPVSRLKPFSKHKKNQNPKGYQRNEPAANEIDQESVGIHGSPQSLKEAKPLQEHTPSYR